MKKNLKRIIFAPRDKITEDAHRLVKALFNTEGAFITNESMLEDFLDFGGREISNQEVREKFIKQIAERFGVVIPEILAGETLIWRVADLIREKQAN